MGRKDFSDLEDQIVSTVKSALDAIDFVNLKRDISDKTEDTLNEFKSKLKEYNVKVENKYGFLNKKPKNDISEYISKRPAGSVSGILYSIFGLIGSVVFGVLVFIFLIFMLFFNGIIPGTFATFGVLLGFLVLSLGLFFRGINLRNRLKRFKKYVRFVEDNSYCLIKDLARFAKEKEEFVLKDLNKMIDLGMFIEGHVDEEKTYFILNDDVYSDYLNLKKQQIAKESNKEKLNKKEEANEGLSDSEREEIKSIIEMGRNYIEQIKKVRNELYKEEIAIKLDKLQNIANQILDYIEKNPKKLQEVNKFINHYLPITIKLINSYKDLSKQLVQGENIKNAKIEIEKSIDIINNAFENLLDDLFEDIVLDISTDISVLKTLFKQEGLTEEDFKK
ncbi:MULTISPECIES: 5-bromo-4-chloroindolyl phosphate hydrolysis family protein [Clostridium]|uniref:5-bromo-4-chloroindolyl phosphate hydrolysis family protein n=1 Tax=Clostridium TaxID=1485 RepID=UPI0018AC3D9A|nr:MULTISPECIES: 5-bromo-4-chloroindolyl phosphate hydrolysis family protein [Clostridium]MDB1931966.1 5-bromo-4-chloroindolyl phosphate hydrolysis family protein [Clostridium tertium]MDB1935591.1 5-bromo-4-chloroindolyl phosphate hydrolysis family protein [Clostridium tertium]MDB1968983.1 5-bromo-4-chloroindolyl phosphate hydrolysis family protein [Clostridium tertium]MDU1567187.1 5-bromo-4-chloroindolyl phosphate hydrolysis family protein [Clostridium sp.]MDU3524413.1 5-bromo-4-chloroindolyl